MKALFCEQRARDDTDLTLTNVNTLAALFWSEMRYDALGYSRTNPTLFRRESAVHLASKSWFKQRLVLSLFYSVAARTRPPVFQYEEAQDRYKDGQTILKW